MSDLISRKAILKNIEKIRQGVQMMDDTHRADIIMTGMYLCEKAVMDQLSAQPEVIRCKDCRWQKDQSGSTTWLPCMEFITQDDFYCGMAERRTDGVDS